MYNKYKTFSTITTDFLVVENKTEFIFYSERIADVSKPGRFVRVLDI